MIKKLLNTPDHLLAVLFGVLLISYQFLNDTFPVLQYQTYVHVTLFILFFSIFFRFSAFFFGNLSVKKVVPIFPRQILYTATICLFGYSISRIAYVVVTQDLGSAMGFRSLVSGGSEQAKFSIGVGISFPAMLATYVFARSNLQYSLSKIAMFLAFILAVASTSKIFILIAVIVIVYEGGGRLKGALVLLALMLVLFGFSHILLAKFSSDPEIGMFSALINTLFVYSYGGIAAYSELLKGSVVLDPLASFVSLKSFFDIFFVNSIASDPILPWVDIGRWNTNNYTALGYWYAFLGGFYVFFVPLFLGTFYGFFFNVESLNKPAFHLYRILLVFCLIFTMWGDLFFPALKVHIAFMFFSLLSSLTKKTRLPNVY